MILNGGIIASIIGPTGPEQRRLANKVIEEALNLPAISFQAITYIVSTGCGRINVPFADKQFTEITCHAKGIVSLFLNAKTVIVTGGGAKNRGLLKALSEQLGHEILVPEEPLITGALGAALMGKEIEGKAKQNNTSLQRKERMLEEIEIL